MEKKESLFPNICVCVKGETDIKNYQNILTSFFKILTEEEKKKLELSYKEPFKLSFHSYGDKHFDKKRKIEHELAIMVSDGKENFKKSIKFLTVLKNKTEDKEKIRNIDFILEQHNKALKDNFPETGICRFYIKMKLLVHKKLTIDSIEKGNFIDEFEDVNKLLNIFKKIKVQATGFTCNELVFDSNKFRLLGNFTFPVKIAKIPNIKEIPYAKELMETIGEPRIDGVTFSFEKSPYGLKRISLTKGDKQYGIQLIINYKTDNLEKLIKRNYLHTLNITKLFMVEI